MGSVNHTCPGKSLRTCGKFKVTVNRDLIWILRHFFLNSTNIMDQFYRGGQAGGQWGECESKGGLNHPQAQRKSRCVFIEAQKQPQ